MNRLDQAKTAPWELENLSVRQAKDDGDWTIKAGGGQQPAYEITAAYLCDAVGQLVRQVTRDAIEDEAREWNERIIIMRKKVQRMISTTNIPLSAARVRVAAIEEMLGHLDRDVLGNVKMCRKCGNSAKWSSADCPICFGDLMAITHQDVAETMPPRVGVDI